MPPLLAEHGFSILIEIIGDSEDHSILMDFRISTIGVPYNLQVLGVDFGKIEAFVVSHGHHDHIGAIHALLNTVPQKPRPVVVHPDAFMTTRFHRLPNGRQVPIPGLRKGLVEETGNLIIRWTIFDISRIELGACYG